MNFTLEQTKSTPYVDFKEGNLLIKGNSFPTICKEGYRNLNHYIKFYSKNPLPKTIVKIDVGIINCFTKRFILNTLKQLEKIKNPQHIITVNWFYDEFDDDMLELGYIMQSLITLPFNFIPKFKNQKQSLTF